MSGLIEGLPDAVALRCLARVPLYLHPLLERVSRSWRAAIYSAELFKARQEVGLSEDFLCVCAFEPENKWQLYDPVRNLWSILPVLPSKVRNLAHFGVVSTAGKLFVLGGGSDAVDPSTGDQDGSFATNEVWSFDFLTGQWAQRASMIVPRAMFACCLTGGKIVVAGGFTSCRKSISQAEIYDPEKNVWDPIPDLHLTHNSACSGVVIGGKVHVLHKGLSTVQVLDSLTQCWTVHDYGWLQGPMAVVQGALYVMGHGSMYKQERGAWKVVVSLSEKFRKRIGFAMIGLGDDIYLIGGVIIGPDRNWAIESLSDVDVLTLGRTLFTSVISPLLKKCGIDSKTMEDENEQGREAEVAPALISVHPAQHYVTVAVGSDLRVFNLQEGCSVSLVDESTEPLHKDSIRAIRFGANGKLFVSAGDDKLVKIWSTDSWRCLYSVSSEKRVSAVAISNGGRFVCFADKFGIVWVVELDGIHENQALVCKKAEPLLAHYCSIITSLVTAFPKKPLDGAHEIQSFCLAHTEFVSCLTFMCCQDYPLGLLVSGSGDSTVRLWDFTSGSLLHTCEVGTEAGIAQSNGRKEASNTIVTGLCTTPDGSLVAVAIQRQLSRNNAFGLQLFCQNPFCCQSLLWMVMGVSSSQSSGSASLARVKVISGFSQNAAESTEPEPIIVADKEIPGGEQLLLKLQGNLSVEEEAKREVTEKMRWLALVLVVEVDVVEA
ncbi:hypothetical protein RJ639_025617 [Escallonia herrerae]|uniref:Uncharacterized protein n=1 Tax=Escallonia herrerae TaxID=1293975 RepID=A0AA88UY64_9ASTE|nr:hypothetical protein RJ639_025617 [Escallonia herrerae]